MVDKILKRKNLKYYNCNMGGHMKKDCWYNKKNEEKSPATSPSHRCIASISRDGEILYNEVALSSKGKEKVLMNLF